MPSSTRRVIVTGAASGIDAAVADVLDASGWQVERLDLQPADDGGPSFNVADADSWSRVDPSDVRALVHCAGIRTRGTFQDTDVQAFRDLIDVNVTGTFLALQWCCKAAAAGAAADGFSVVVLSSAVVERTVEGQPAYNASKAAVRALGRSAALELAEHGGRVNVVAPGSILTPMTEAGWADLDHAARMAGEIPAKRPGRAEEVASVVSFLVSPESSYMNGQTVTVDGGWTL